LTSKYEIFVLPHPSLESLEDAFSYDDRLRKLKESAKRSQDIVPVLPWFDALYKKESEEDVDQFVQEKKVWKFLKSLSSYYTLRNEVEEDLKMLFPGISYLPCILSFLFPFQLLSSNGRKRWFKASKACMWTFLISFGIWPAELVEELELKEKFNYYADIGNEVASRSRTPIAVCEFNAIREKLYKDDDKLWCYEDFCSIEASKLTSLFELSNQYLRNRRNNQLANEEEKEIPKPLTAEDQEKLRRLNEGEEASDITNIEDERCLRFSDFLSSFAVSRIVLAVWFNIAAELTSCPLFAAIDNDERANKKSRYLPNLTYFAQDAKDMVDHNFNDPPHGLVFLLQMYLLFRKSRVITFMSKFVVATAALVVNFIPEGLYIIYLHS